MNNLMCLLTTGQAARTLGLSEALVRHYVRTGRLSRVLSPHGALFTPEEVERLRREREAKTDGAPTIAAAR